MLSVIIRDDGEPNVIKLTYENLFKELKAVPESELLVADEWLVALDKVKNDYVCFVEADCLVSSGYFASQIGLFKKNTYMRKLAMMSSAVGINNWANRIYGFKLGNRYVEGIVPVREQSSKGIYPIQMGYLPGSIIRTNMLRNALKSARITKTKDLDLVGLSAVISLEFWQQGDGNRVHINPNTTYVTTEDYVSDICKSSVDPGDLAEMFDKESI